MPLLAGHLELHGVDVEPLVTAEHSMFALGDYAEADYGAVL